MNAPQEALSAVKLDFVTQWGVLGSVWGINRTMAMLHGLLLTSPAPLSTDEMMDALAISRGNANTNVRELIAWGLVRRVVRPGERREYFEAEKDAWKIYCAVVRERKRREVDPTLAVLRDCAARAAALRGAEAREFSKVLQSLVELVEFASRIMDGVLASERSKIIPAVLKLFK
jgi:DNA-binding transcriptional regulator GbsR (MarR family)